MLDDHLADPLHPHHEAMEIAHEDVDALTRDSAHLVELRASLGEARAELVGELARLGHVDLGERDDLRALGELRAERRELLADREVIGERLASFAGVHRDEVEQRARALDVLQEANAEPDAFARAGDQAGDVGDHERRAACARASADGHHAERGRERGEGIIRDDRARGRHGGDEGALARVGEAHEPDVRHHLELEQEIAPLAGLALLRAARRAIVRQREVDVAAPSAAAARDDHALSVLGHVGDELARRRVFDLRPERDTLDAIAPRATVAVLAHAVPAALGGERSRLREVEQRGEARVAREDDVASLASVAARGPAERDELLAAERDGAVAARTRDDLDATLIDETHRALIPWGRPWPRGAAARRAPWCPRRARCRTPRGRRAGPRACARSRGRGPSPRPWS